MSSALLRTSLCAAALTTCVLVGSLARADVGEAFGISIFSEQSQALWPIQLDVSIARLDTEHEPIEFAPVFVRHGASTRFVQGLAEPSGPREISISLVPRHHARQHVELEIDVVVRDHEAAPKPAGCATAADDQGVATLTHNALGVTCPEVSVGARVPTLSRTRAIRADLVSVPSGSGHSISIDLGTERYEIRIGAKSTRD